MNNLYTMERERESKEKVKVYWSPNEWKCDFDHEL